MRFLIAPNSFKGSLTARQAAAAMARGIRRACPTAGVDCIPMTDGGDGFLAVLEAAGVVQRCDVWTWDAQGRACLAGWGLRDTGDPRSMTAYVEMAQAAGLAQLVGRDLDPMRASTFGVGHVVRTAMAQGVRKFVIGLGGSATNDGGVGFLQALGVQFLDQDGHELSDGDGTWRACPATLVDLAAVDWSHCASQLQDLTIVIASDVSNPLCGNDGASWVFGPQKGASPEQCLWLDDRLTRWATVSGHPDLAAVPGAGAAGGLGFALLLLGGIVQSGADVVMDLCEFSAALAESDVVLTGEGSLDQQSLAGKAPVRIAQAARQAGVPVVCFAGRVPEDRFPIFTEVVGITPVECDDWRGLAAINLENAVASWLSGLTDDYDDSGHSARP